MPAERAGAGVGAVLVGLHALLLFGLLARASRAELTLAVPADAVVLLAPDGRLPDDTRVPAELATRARRLVDGAPAAPAVLAPGVHRVEWQAWYRGGFERRVGRTVLAGPLQDPAHPPCGVRLVVGQALLDALAPLLVARVEAGMAGQLGFRQVERVELVLDAGDAARVPPRRAGIALTLLLRFSRGRVPVYVRVAPSIVAGRLALTAEVDARVQLDWGWLEGTIELLGQTERLNGLVRDVARGEVDLVLGPVECFLSRPPPVPLEGGRELHLAYCESEPITIVQARSLTVPLAVPVLATASGVLPVRLPGSPPPGPPDAPIAIDISLDAANAVLHQMWSSGALDVLLAGQGLERRFNESQDVRDLLTVRAGAPRLSMPPTLAPSHDPERPVALSVEAELLLLDGALRTPARLYGRASLDLRSGAGQEVLADVAVTDLALTCVPEPGRLTACYAALFEAARSRSPELHPPLAAALRTWFADLVAGRELGGTVGTPRIVLTSARLTPRIDSQSGWFRVELRGQVRDD